MSDNGAWGWLGANNRIFELPSDQNSAAAPSGRARMRFNPEAQQLEGSIEGGDWQALALASGGGGMVENLTALSAVDDTAIDNSTSVAVETLYDVFQLNKSSTDTADGITVVPTASGTGRWLRKGCSSLVWLSQAEWYINADTGDDENSGADGFPLKSIGEYTRRIGSGLVIADPYQNLYLSGDFDEGSYIFRGTYPNSYGLYIQGERTVVGTGTISAVQEWDGVAETAGQIEDSGLPVSWADSGLVGRMIVLTSGANVGAVAWLAKDLGLKTVRHSPFATFFGGSLLHPSVGDTYEVVSLTNVKGFMDVDVGRSIFWQDCRLELVAHLNIGMITNARGWIYIMACEVTANFSLYNRHHGFDLNIYNSKIGCDWTAKGGAVLTARFSLLGSKLSGFQSFVAIENSLLQGGLASPESEAGVSLQNSFFSSYTGVIGCYDNTATYVLRLREMSVASARTNVKVFGTDNTGTVLFVASGCQVLYPDGADAQDHFAVVTLGDEVRYGGTVTTYAAIGVVGVVNAANNAMVVPAEF